jgi:VanZ family protein
MWRYFKDYPFSIIIVLIVIYLSVTQPPKIGILLFKNADKFIHFCMYGGISGVFWLEYLFKHRKKKLNYFKAFIGGVLTPILLGGAIELFQRYFTRFRSGDWFDMSANISGVVIATVIALFLLRPLILKRPKTNV